MIGRQGLVNIPLDIGAVRRLNIPLDIRAVRRSTVPQDQCSTVLAGRTNAASLTFRDDQARRGSLAECTHRPALALGPSDELCTLPSTRGRAGRMQHLGAHHTPHILC